MELVKVTQTKSKIGSLPAQKKTIQALGLRRIRHSVVLEATPQVMGMIGKVSHMVAIEKLKKGKTTPSPIAASIKKQAEKTAKTKTAAGTKEVEKPKAETKQAAETKAKPKAETKAKAEAKPKAEKKEPAEAEKREAKPKAKAAPKKKTESKAKSGGEGAAKQTEDKKEE
jgi:large subunit ribosomal protein L30